jgi:hypothetical protein
MQNREILMAHNPSQSKYRIVTGAETLGELKEEIARNENVYKMVGQSWVKNDSPVDISGLTFTEGISKTQLLTDDSQLPVNVLFKGQPTNNLVMLLTNTRKNIPSGADYPTDRKLFGPFIKDNNLGELIKEKFGNNWTRVATDKLIAFFSEQGSHNQQELEETREELAELYSKEPKLPPHVGTVNWLFDGVKEMVKENVLYVEDVVALEELLQEYAHRLVEAQPKITEEDVDEMISNILP